MTRLAYTVQLWHISFVVAALLAAPSVARAQEPSGLQAAVAIERAMMDAIAQAEKSVVSIARMSSEAATESERGMLDSPFRPRQMRESHDPRDADYVPKEFATGVVIDAKGFILTTYHCVRKGDLHKIVTINRKLFNTSIYAADPRSDLAVLRVDDGQKIAPDDFVPIKFGDAKQVRKGQIVITLGNPHGIARDGQVSASWGIISNLARKASPKPADQEPTLHQFGTLIQTDARLNWGTSGGALVNLKGEMVGLTTSLPVGNGVEQAAGYAIPIDDTFRRIIDTLKQGKSVDFGFLGVSPRGIRRPEEKGQHGLVIDNVSPGGPASRAGLSNEDVVTHIDGEPVYDFDDLRRLVGRFAAGSTVAITYEQGQEKGGRVNVANVVVGKYRKSGLQKAREAIVSVTEPLWRGMQVDFSTAVVEMRSIQSALPMRIAVSAVLPDSPAAKAGVHPGMFVANVGNTPVDSPSDFHRAVAKLSGPVTLQVIDGANSLPIGAFSSLRFITIEPE